MCMLKRNNTFSTIRMWNTLICNFRGIINVEKLSFLHGHILHHLYKLFKLYYIVRIYLRDRSSNTVHRVVYGCGLYEYRKFTRVLADLRDGSEK